MRWRHARDSWPQDCVSGLRALPSAEHVAAPSPLVERRRARRPHGDRLRAGARHLRGLPADPVASSLGVCYSRGGPTLGFTAARGRPDLLPGGGGLRVSASRADWSMVVVVTGGGRMARREYAGTGPGCQPSVSTRPTATATTSRARIGQRHTGGKFRPEFIVQGQGLQVPAPWSPCADGSTKVVKWWWW